MSNTSKRLNIRDFVNICRICLKTSRLQCIFSFKHVNRKLKKTDLSGIIKMCCGIDTFVGDDLPNNICIPCSKKLFISFELRKICQKNDKILKDLVYSTKCKSSEKVTKQNLSSHTRKKNSKKEFELNGTENKTDKNILEEDFNDDFWDENNSEKFENSFGCESSQVNEFCCNGDDIKNNECLSIEESNNCDVDGIICPVCDIHLGEDGLGNHMSKCHSGLVNGGFKCYGCEEILDNRYERELHEDLYCSKMPVGTIYTCSVCGCTASYREDFDKHLWLSHRGRAPPKSDRVSGHADPIPNKKDGYVCETCGQVLKSNTTFNHHMMRHEGKQWLKCNMCSFKTSDHRAITVHKLRHEGRKPFECQECSYKTDRIDYLKVHQMRHSGEKPYACPYCDYRAVNHSNLKKHKATHTNVREFQCKVCEKFYKSNRALKNHTLRAHENAQLFHCKPCHNKYLGEEAYNAHVEKKHPNSQSNHF